MNFIEAIDGGKYEVFEPDIFSSKGLSSDTYIHVQDGAYRWSGNNVHVGFNLKMLSSNNWQRRPKEVVPPEGYELVPKGAIRPTGYKYFCLDRWFDAERFDMVGKPNDADYALCAPIPGTCYWAKAQMDNGEKVTCDEWCRPFACFAHKVDGKYKYRSGASCNILEWSDITDFHIYVPLITQEDVDKLRDEVITSVDKCYDPFNEDSDAENLRLIRDKYADYLDMDRRLDKQNNS